MHLNLLSTLQTLSVMKAFNYILLIILVSLSLFACKSKTNAKISSTDFTGEHYEGEAFTKADVMHYDDLLKKMDKDGGAVNVQVMGRIDGVCQAKGCWMTMVSNTPGADTMFVKFKDYGFFMPKDLGGQEVVMRGDAYYEETSVDELRHYAEDEGQSEEEIMKITEPLVELKFLADGVIFK